MADAAVEFLLGNLKQLLVYNVNLISDVKDHVDSLCNELRLLAAFVKDATDKRSKFAIVDELVNQIRVAVYEAEDVVDTFVVLAAVQKTRSQIVKVFHITDYPAKLRSVAKDIETIRKKVKDIYDNNKYGFQALLVGESSNSGPLEKMPPVVEEDNVVGFDIETKMLVDQLTAQVAELEVICVVGMGGLGKTTLARKVFNDRAIQFEFFIRAWIYVSQEYIRREVFLDILSQVTQVSRGMYRMTDNMLADELRRHLQGGRYLIVLDDVWTKEAWDDLKIAFPKNKNGSRIMLTSRIREVAVHANPDSDPHQLRFLTHDESWELLHKRVFRKRSCPSELEVLGKEIAKKCYGLPLAIVVIAGILRRDNNDKTSSYWEKVAESVSSYVAMDPKRCMEVLALSYNHLPYDLRACFLYFGVFPEDFEIPVWKLIHIWVAEGFIQQKGDLSLEDIAEDNLVDLVGRNLILVEKRRSNGRIRTCRIHDMLHDLCVEQARKENFFQEIKGSVPIHSPTGKPNIFRRLCIHSRVLEYISSEPSDPRVRSFLCYASEDIVLTPKQMSYIPGLFSLLRVLDIRPISFPRFPPDVFQLVHLRYIALLGTFEVLPEKTSYLWNLQTLIVETTSRKLTFKADIWKMLHLRHLYTSASSDLLQIKSQKGDKNPLVSGNLQTISRLSPDSCSEKILARTPNLKKLGVRGRLVTLLEDNGGSRKFDNLAKLDHLGTLKLLNDTYPTPPAQCKLPGLPRWYQFPPKLKKLTLSDTLLDWEHMSNTLGKLPGLEVLKLGDNAFSGQRWETIDGGFTRLRVLQLGRTDLVRWVASASHFPSLQSLIFKHCEHLKVIPSGLGDISTLQIMELYFPTSYAAFSAREIQQQQQKQQQQGMVKNGFKLLIYPPNQ